MASVTFQESRTDTTDSADFTFSACDFGAAAANRYIIVGVGIVRISGTDDLSSMTASIGGVSATLISFVADTGGQRPVTTLAIANVPTGTTGDVVLALPNFSRDTSIGVYRTTGISPTPTDTGTSLASAPTSDIDVLAGGIIVGVALVASSSTSATWTGLTERYDTAFGTGPDTHSGASVDSASTQTLTCTCTFAASTAGVCGSFASFPAAASGPANLKTWNTNAKANIKTMNTNAIANVKTWDTNA